MLKLELTLHDDQWPLINILVIRESANGRQVQQERIQYDLSHDKAQVMLNNALRPMINEIIARRKVPSRYMQAQGQGGV